MADGESWLKEHAGVVTAAAIAGVPGIVVAIITGIFGLLGNNSTETGPSTTTSQVTANQPDVRDSIGMALVKRELNTTVLLAD